MNQEEIKEAMKKWDLEDDNFYNFKTPKNTYNLYYILCFFESKRLKTTRIINGKCETKIFKPR